MVTNPYRNWNPTLASKSLTVEHWLIWRKKKSQLFVISVSMKLELKIIFKVKFSLSPNAYWCIWSNFAIFEELLNVKLGKFKTTFKGGRYKNFKISKGYYLLEKSLFHLKTKYWLNKNVTLHWKLLWVRVLQCINSRFSPKYQPWEMFSLDILSQSPQSHNSLEI